MALINARILDQVLLNPIPPTAEQLEIARLWAESIRSNEIFKHNESQIEGVFQSRIVEGLLGYQPFGGEGAQTYRPKQPMGKGTVDIALGFFKDERRIVAPFELKGADTRDLDAPMAGRNKTPVQQAWEYANAVAGTKWVLVSNMLEIRLYGFGEGQQDFERIDLAKIDQPKELAKAQLLLGADSLLGTRLADLLRASKVADKDISDRLYSDYSLLRIKLIDAVNDATGGTDKVQSVNTAQKILDRVLFIAFAEDRGLLPSKSLEEAFVTKNRFQPMPIWNNFKGLFADIDGGNSAHGIPKYNGGLFRFDEHVDTLNLSDDICQAFNEIGKYHFDTEVSITVLGHIFEQSVSDIEKLLAKARGEGDDEPEKASGVKGRRKRDGIVYTPDYIAKFIVEKTLGTHIDELFRNCIAKHAKGDVADYDSLKFKKNAELQAWYDFRYTLKTMRVVDPACGSGVFLVTAFDYLKAEYDRVDKKIAQLRGVDAQQDFEDVDREILSQNLYGVDVNAESVEITKLSLWLKTAKKGKELDSLDHNIRVGDSLIEDSSFAYLEHGFSWNKAFPEVFAAGGFDVVLGNPPYVRMELIKPMKPYLETRFDCYDSKADLYCYFFERGLRLLKQNGKLGYISSSSFLKASFGDNLRKLLRKFEFEMVADFGNETVFEGVTTYPNIFVFKNAVASNKPIEYLQVGYNGPDVLRREIAYPKFHSYSKDRLKRQNWHFEASKNIFLRDKLEANAIDYLLSEVEPLNGIKTGYNPAFVLAKQDYSDWHANDGASSSLLRNWMTGDDVAKWLPEQQTEKRLLFVKKGDTKQLLINSGKALLVDDELEAWGVFSSNYPYASSWLKKHEDKCRKRSDQGDFWWELRACDYYDAFEKSAVLYPEMSQGPKFCSKTRGTICNNKTFFLPISSEHLLAYLNSSVAWFFLNGLCSSLRGGEWRLELRTDYLKRLPFPKFPTTQIKALSDCALGILNAKTAAGSSCEAFTRRIPDLCPPSRDAKLSTKLQDWWKLDDFAAFRAEVGKVYKADIPLKERSDWEDLFTAGKTEIEKLNAEIKRNEDEINAIVYELFDLTKDEIALLEESIGVRKV